jgi:hypothetical protein
MQRLQSFAATEATASATDTFCLKSSVMGEAGQGQANSPTCVHKHAVIVIGARRCAAQSHR